MGADKIAESDSIKTIEQQVYINEKYSNAFLSLEQDDKTLKTPEASENNENNEQEEPETKAEPVVEPIPDSDNQNDESDKITLPTVNESYCLKENPVLLKTGKFLNETTDSNGTINIKYLNSGIWGFAERHSIDGYVTDRTPQYIEIAADGRINGEDVGYLNFSDDWTKLLISKVDLTNSEELPGNTLSIYKKSDTPEEEYGELIEQWVSSTEPHYVEKLPVGDYVLKEEQPADGYLLAGDIEFSVSDSGEVQHVTMKNERVPEVPQPVSPSLPTTGDMVLIIGGLLIAGGGIIILMLRRTRKRV